MMTAQERQEVQDAHAAGAVIEFKALSGGDWTTIVDPAWYFAFYEYRVKAQANQNQKQNEQKQLSNIMITLYDGTEADEALCVQLHSGEWVLEEDTVTDYAGSVRLTDDCYELYDGRWVDRDSDDVVIIGVGEHSGEYALSTQCLFIEHESEWALNTGRQIVHLHNGDYGIRHDCHYIDGEWYIDSDCSRCDNCDDMYVTEEGCCCSRSGDPEYLQEYHGSDISCKVYQNKSWSPYNTTPTDKNGLPYYTIGFEVEKASINGEDCENNHIGNTGPLFAYWETDGSCGVEGVTHAYSLDNYELFAQHVSASASAVNGPSNDRCGGHVSLRGPKVDMNNIRKFAGLLYAIYRKRLNNSYCRDNKPLAQSRDYHYDVVRMRGDCFFEFRLIARVKNTTQLLNRFRLMQFIARGIYEDRSFRWLIKETRPLMREIYPDASKRVEIRTLAKRFNDYLNKGVIHESIQQYI